MPLKVLGLDAVAYIHSVVPFLMTKMWGSIKFNMDREDIENLTLLGVSGNKSSSKCFKVKWHNIKNKK